MPAHIVALLSSGCCEKLKRSAEEIKDTNFSVLIQPARRGQAIEHYLTLFDKEASQSSSMTVNVQNGSGKSTRKANGSTLQWDHEKLLVTQLS